MPSGAEDHASDGPEDGPEDGAQDGGESAERADETDASEIERAEVELVEQVAPYRHAPLVRGLGRLSELADQPPLVALSLGVIGAGLLTDQRRFCRAGTRMLAAHALATGMKAVLKALVARTRPHVYVELGRYEVRALGPNEGPWNSFPSGHTAGAVAVAAALRHDLPELAPAANVAAAMVAIIQVPRCAHYPSDIGAGALVGLAAERLTELALRRSGLVDVRHGLWQKSGGNKAESLACHRE